MPVIQRREGQTLVVTLNRAAKRNAIDAELTDGIDSALNELEDDSSLRVGIVTGAGGVFSAGTDLKATAGRPTARGGSYGIIRRRGLKPLIAAVEGVALGGGFEIVLACDLVVAARDAAFGLPEARRGVIPTCGGLFRTLRKLPENLANELLLGCDPVGAERLHQFGFVNRLTEPGAALDAALTMATTICLNSPVSIMESLRVMRGYAAADDGEAWRATEVATEVVAASEDRQEGVRAFFEKRVPQWRGQ